MSKPVVLREIPVRGHGAQAPGAYVLRDFGEGTTQRYVVHFRNDQAGGYCDGSYCETLERAEARLAERSSWVGPYHDRLRELGV
jgi:hypothetical protein